MKELASKNMNWDSFFVELQSRGRYTFTFNELQNRFSDLSEDALLQGLYRNKVKKQIVQIRKSFYAIISPEYSAQGMLPPYLFMDDLMKNLNKPYYVALFSAAALHGASHQQLMEYFVIAQTPAPRSIQNKKLTITFLSKTIWDTAFIIQKKTSAGYMNVSSPELTALDLLAYSGQYGLNMTTTVLQELSEEMKPSVLSRIAKKQSETPVIQRLGYILDRVLNEEKLAESLYKILIDRHPLPVLLSIKKAKNGEIDDKWNVIKNMEIESDL